MAFKEIEVRGKTIKLEANGATPHIYKRIFKEDSMTAFPKILEAFLNGGTSLEELNKITETSKEMESEDGEKLLFEHGTEIFPVLKKLVESGMMNFVEQMAFTMNMQAEKSTTECLRLNAEDFIEWISRFEPNAFMFASAEILGLYMANNKTSVVQKNAHAPQ